MVKVPLGIRQELDNIKKSVSSFASEKQAPRRQLGVVLPVFFFVFAYSRVLIIAFSRCNLRPRSPFLARRSRVIGCNKAGKCESGR